MEDMSAQPQFLFQRGHVAGVAQQRAEQFGQVFQRRLGRRGALRISDSTALRLLNRKCGRIRACSACSRASASAGEKARVRSSK